MKFLGHVQKVQMQGSLSQIFDLRPSLIFIKCRILFMKEIARSSRFLS